METLCVGMALWRRGRSAIVGPNRWVFFANIIVQTEYPDNGTPGLGAQLYGWFFEIVKKFVKKYQEWQNIKRDKMTGTRTCRYSHMSLIEICPELCSCWYHYKSNNCNYIKHLQSYSQLNVTEQKHDAKILMKRHSLCADMIWSLPNLLLHTLWMSRLLSIDTYPTVPNHTRAFCHLMHLQFLPWKRQSLCRTLLHTI